MNLYTIELKNQPGELAHVCEILGARGVNVEVGGVTVGDHGAAYFTTSDETRTRTALEGSGIEFTEQPALPFRSTAWTGPVKSASSPASWKTPT